MIVHQVFAIVHEETVQNIIVCDNYELANQIARGTYGNEAIAVDCLQYPCFIGCKYKINNSCALSFKMLNSVAFC